MQTVWMFERTDASGARRVSIHESGVSAIRLANAEGFFAEVSTFQGDVTAEAKDGRRGSITPMPLRND